MNRTVYRLGLPLAFALVAAVPAGAEPTPIPTAPIPTAPIPTARSGTKVANERTSERDAALTNAAAKHFKGRPHQAALYRNGVLIAATGGAGTAQRAASVSKVATAAAVFALVDAGRLTLNETLGDHFGPGIHPSVRQVTVSQLLSHTSGFPAERDRWFGGSYRNCLYAAATAVNRSTPGHGRYQYSNTNYCVLSIIVALRTGGDYQRAVHELVFAPLGITTASYDPSYVRLEGAGAWKMSAVDAGRLLVAVDPARPEQTLLSTPSRSAMVAGTSYNYGRGLWRWPDGSYGHSGTLNAARNIVVRLPNGDVVAVMVQANSPTSGLALLPVARALSAAVR
jgi:D-alanyl-D-alanine carboxypeptidase